MGLHFIFFMGLSGILENLLKLMNAQTFFSSVTSVLDDILY